MAKRGRPDKLTPEVQEALVNALSLGNFRGPAARFAGISARTLSEWLALGEKHHHGKFRTLLTAVRKAEADAEVRMVAQLMTHAKKDTRAVQFFLERKHSERWGANVRVHVEHELTSALERLRQEFCDEPEIYERCLTALVREGSEAGASAIETGAGGGDAAADAPADSTPTKSEAT